MKKKFLTIILACLFIVACAIGLVACNNATVPPPHAISKWLPRMKRMSFMPRKIT